MGVSMSFGPRAGRYRLRVAKDRQGRAVARFTGCVVVLATAAFTQAASYTWNGANAVGNWSVGGAGGNWSEAAAPDSRADNDLVFAGNASGQVANNDIADPCDVRTLRFATPGLVLTGGRLRFPATAATNLAFGAYAATFSNALELAADCTLSTTTANPIQFLGQLMGPGKLTYVNAGTSAGTLFTFASPVPNTINGFTLGNASIGRGKATLQIAMDNPFGGAGTQLRFDNSDASIQVLDGDRTVASDGYRRANLTFSGSHNLTFPGSWTVFTGGSRTFDNNFAAGKVLTLAAAAGATFDSSRTSCGGTGYTVVEGAVVDTVAGATAGYQGFIKTGAGTWRLNGANTYRSLTTISGGTLALGPSGTTGSSHVRLTTAGAVFDVSAVAAPGYTLGAGRTLAGIGTVRGAFTAEAGAGVEPGNTVVGAPALGALTVNLTSGVQRVTFAAGAAFACDLGAPGTSDTLAFTGLTNGVAAVAFNGNAVNCHDVGGLGKGLYTLFTFDAANAYTGTLTIGAGLEAFGGSQFIFGASRIQLNVAPTQKGMVWIIR